jgi:hypothetical protein
MGEFRIILNIGIVYMKKIGIFVISFVAADTLFAQSTPLSYDYVEGNLGTGDIFDEDYSFYGAGISYSVNESLFLRGSYFDGSTDYDIDFDVGFSKVELSGYDVGLGFHTPVHPMIDFVVSGSYISREFEVFGFSDDGDGYSVDAGFRFKPTGQLELNVFADYEDIESENETGYSASAYYFFTPTFSVGGVYAKADDLDSIAASVRFHF